MTLSENDKNTIIVCIVLAFSAILIAAMIWHFIGTETHRADIRDQTIINTSNNQTGNLSIYLNNIQSLQLAHVKLQSVTNALLANISKKLDIVPVVTMPLQTPIHNQNCNIYSKAFPFCILPNYNSHNH